MSQSVSAQTAKLFADDDLTKRVWRYLDRPIVDPDRALPTPTRDLASLRADFDTHGYCFVADAANADLRTALKQRVREQFAAEQQLGDLGDRPYGTEAVYNLLNKGEIFQKTVLNPLVDQIVEHALGESFLLSAYVSHTTAPGSLAQGLHVDQMYFGFPSPMPLICNAVWMLDDFTEENGATRIVPGSHLWSADKIAANYEGLVPAGGDGKQNPKGTIAAVAPAGSCMLFDGRLLHGAGVNKTRDQHRFALFAYYCRPFVRQLENPFLSIDDELMIAFPQALRNQLGYLPWAFCGGCEAPGRPAPTDLVRPRSRVGKLTFTVSVRRRHMACAARCGKAGSPQEWTREVSTWERGGHHVEGSAGCHGW